VLLTVYTKPIGMTMSKSKPSGKDSEVLSRIGPADYRAESLRILARIIARVYLRNNQLKGKKSNNHGERGNK